MKNIVLIRETTTTIRVVFLNKKKKNVCREGRTGENNHSGHIPK